MNEEFSVDLTEVVDKVAQFQYERHSKVADNDVPWDQLGALPKFAIKETVTPLVVATLKAAGVSTN